MPTSKIVLGFCPNEGPERFILDIEPVLYETHELAYEAGVAALNRPGSTTKAFRLFTVGDTYRVVCRIEPDAQ